MEKIKITDNFAEKLHIGRELFEKYPQKYPQERVDDMYRQIRALMTDSMAKKFSEDDVFFHSIYDFWVYGNVISEEIYFHFLYKTHEEKKKYTTFRSRLVWMYQINDKSLAHLFHDKWETYELFSKYYLRDVVKISSDADFDLFDEFVKKNPVFVVKPLSSHLGIGVKKIDLAEYSDNKALFDELLNLGKVHAKDSFFNDASLMLEEVIDQDPALAAIHPYSVNGIRISTFRRDGKVTILYPWFKVGANKSFVTSAAFGTYDAGIDAETGVVYTDGFKENGEYDVVHPLTNIVFKGYQIPKWSELVETVKEMALSLPDSINYIGWDMVLTPKGWCIMEGNFTGDFMWQMFNQKGCKTEWEQLTGIEFGDYFWWEK